MKTLDEKQLAAVVGGVNQQNPWPPPQQDLSEQHPWPPPQTDVGEHNPWPPPEEK